MSMNRHSMLQASIVATVSLWLTGCAFSGTTLVVVNNTDGPLSVDVIVSGVAFKKDNIQPGSSASQFFVTRDPYLSSITALGTVTWRTIDLVKPKTYEYSNVTQEINLGLKIGKTNTYTFSIHTFDVPQARILEYVYKAS